MLKCSICFAVVDEKYGNNAYPVNEGRCCSHCNYAVVIPARLNMIYFPEGKNKENKKSEN